MTIFVMTSADFLVGSDDSDLYMMIYIYYIVAGIFTNASNLFGTLPIFPELCIFLHAQDTVFEPHKAIVESSKLLVPSIGM